jgi:hypothetical protein
MAASAAPSSTSSPQVITSWGSGGSGSLGQGDCEDRSIPLITPAVTSTSEPLPLINMMVCSGGHTLALTTGIAIFIDQITIKYYKEMMVNCKRSDGCDTYNNA